MPNHTALADSIRIKPLDPLDSEPNPKELLMPRNLANPAIEDGEATNEIE
jgi:hypothetical protein